MRSRHLNEAIPVTTPLKPQLPRATQYAALASGLLLCLVACGEQHPPPPPEATEQQQQPSQEAKPLEPAGAADAVASSRPQQKTNLTGLTGDVLLNAAKASTEDEIRAELSLMGQEYAALLAEQAQVVAAGDKAKQMANEKASQALNDRYELLLPELESRTQ